MEIIKSFGGKKQYLAALKELKNELYRVAWYVVLSRQRNAPSFRETYKPKMVRGQGCPPHKNFVIITIIYRAITHPTKRYKDWAITP
jgi:hypothetical protein